MLPAKRYDSQLVGQLIQAAKHRDRGAFDKLVEMHRDYIYGAVRRIVGNTTVAEDIAQEAFVKAWHSLPSFIGASQFHTWLMAIAIRLCLDERRRSERKPTDSYDDWPMELAERSLLGLCSPERDEPWAALETKELQTKVHMAIKQLSFEHQQMIVLYDFMGFSYEEIASMVGLPIGTVKSRLGRARASLKSHLVGYTLPDGSS